MQPSRYHVPGRRPLTLAQRLRRAVYAATALGLSGVALAVLGLASLVLG